MLLFTYELGNVSNVTSYNTVCYRWSAGNDTEASQMLRQSQGQLAVTHQPLKVEAGGKTEDCHRAVKAFEALYGICRGVDDLNDDEMS